MDDNRQQKTVERKESEIDVVLRERGSKYGPYNEHARITQDLLAVITKYPAYHKLPQFMKESLHMIFHKIGRIINGDPFYLDSWIDIGGYNQLTIEEIIKIDKQRDAEFQAVQEKQIASSARIDADKFRHDRF